MAEYCLFSGKALRPLITLKIFKSLAGYSFKVDNPVIRDLMLSVELIHTASLLSMIFLVWMTILCEEENLVFT